MPDYIERAAALNVNFKIPLKVKNALLIISGYCRKQSSCDECPLESFCGIVFRFPPSVLPKQEVEA